MHLRIISGGQTGVDRGALDAALAAGVECGGWCPAGRLDEEGRIPERYPVREFKEGGYLERTIQNITNTDGTLVLYFSELAGGTEETVFQCIKLRKPYKLIDGSEISVARAAELSTEWIKKHGIWTLNVAGPRKSKASGAYEYALSVIRAVLK
jgi:hypothetical protein